MANTFPIAALADCGVPEIPANGTATITTNSLDKVVLYTCNYGYELRGSSQRICRGRTWDGQPPVCKNAICILYFFQINRIFYLQVSKPLFFQLLRTYTNPALYKTPKLIYVFIKKYRLYNTTNGHVDGEYPLQEAMPVFAIVLIIVCVCLAIGLLVAFLVLMKYGKYALRCYFFRMSLFKR